MQLSRQSQGCRHPRAQIHVAMNLCLATAQFLPVKLNSQQINRYGAQTMANLLPSANNKKDTMSSANFIDGFWFYFQDGDTDIAVHGSAWSGKETVYVNDNPVSSKRELLKLVSEHEFVHNGHQYRVRYHVTSLIRADLECSVYKDGQLLAAQTKGVVKTAKQGWLTILKMFVFGLIFGALAASLVKYLTA